MMLSRSFSSSRVLTATNAAKTAGRGTATRSSDDRRPLSGIKVLDLSRILAGPWCTMLLGDAGADVIKVERPIIGDDTRSWGPPFVPAIRRRHNAGNTNDFVVADDDQDDDNTIPINERRMSTYFMSVNRNKKSVSIDITNPIGRDICRRLAIEWADVVVENFKVGGLKKYGLDYESLSTANPALIYCSITGFGPTGPLSKQPGYDVILSGMYGLISITGHPDKPAKVGVALTDVLTGSLAYGGILAALHQRERTGLGQQVDVSLMETQLSSLVNIATSTLNNDSVPITDEFNSQSSVSPPAKRWGTAHESIVPYQAFACKRRNDSIASTGKRRDGGQAGEEQHDEEYIVVGAGNDLQFQKLCHVLGFSELASDPRFRTNADRVQHREEIIAILETHFRKHTRDEWVKILGKQDFPFGPVRTVSEAFQCEQAIHRGMVQEMHHPSLSKPIRIPRTPITYSSAGTGTKSSKILEDGMTTHHPNEDITKHLLPPPMLGEHTVEVLQEILDLEPEEIRKIHSDGVIGFYEL